MTELDFNLLTKSVAFYAFVLGIAFGAVAQKTNFCTMGAIADWVNFGDTSRFRMWLLALGVAMVGTSVLAWQGVIDTRQTIYTQSKLLWLSHLLGGAMFGFGMVLAGGCGSKTLIRIGGGSLKSLLVFVVMGVSAYITLRGLLGVMRVNWIDAVALQLSTPQDIPSILGSSPRALPWLGVAAGFVLILISVLKKSFITVEHLLGGIGIGALVVLTWYLSGHIGFVSENPNTLQEAFVATNSGRMESLSFVAPMAYTIELLMLWSDKSKIVTLGVASAAGVIVGSLLVALVTRTFRWEGLNGTEDTANHWVGAVLMGVGGILALGCTIGQGLSGLSVLSLGAILTTAAIFLGGYAGMKYQTWRVERM